MPAICPIRHWSSSLSLDAADEMLQQPKSFSRWRPSLALRREAARQSGGNECWALHQQVCPRTSCESRNHLPAATSTSPQPDRYAHLPDELAGRCPPNDRRQLQETRYFTHELHSHPVGCIDGWASAYHRNSIISPRPCQKNNSPNAHNLNWYTHYASEPGYFIVMSSTASPYLGS